MLKITIRWYRCKYTTTDQTQSHTTKYCKLQRKYEANKQNLQETYYLLIVIVIYLLVFSPQQQEKFP